jgi:hypothetical protein
VGVDQQQATGGDFRHGPKPSAGDHRPSRCPRGGAGRMAG